MGSEGRRTARYKAARAAILGQPCWECGAPTTHAGPNATRADHYPPIGDTLEPIWWAQGGRIRPHCTDCSCRQGQRLATAARTQTPSRQW